MSAKRRLRIGIDVTSWINIRGFGRFTRELVGTLVERDRENDYVLVTDPLSDRAPDLPAASERLRVDTREAPARAASAAGSRSLSDLWRMSMAVRRTPLDLFFFPTDYTFFPVPRRIPLIVGVHDTTTWKHPELIFPNWRSRLFWRMKEKMAVASADAIVTVSESARGEIVEYLGVRREKITILPEAASSCFAPRELGAAEIEKLAAVGASPRDGYVLHVGGVSPHKNLERLVRAFARIARDPRHSRLRLVLAGDTGGEDVFHSSLDAVRGLLEREALAERVVLTGFVSDELLALLYNGASVLAFPSFSEGFGLPAVEAMASGTPVVASAKGSLPEVLGDATITFDPASEDELERALRAVLQDEATRDRLRAAGLARARLFSWERAAEILLGLIRATARGG